MSPPLADIVAKVFLGCRTKIPRAADAFHPGQCEGPYRFMQNPPPTFAVALNGDLVAEKSKNRLSRDFYAPSIFDFCNNIGTNRASSNVRCPVAIGGKADVGQTPILVATIILPLLHHAAILWTRLHRALAAGRS